MRSAPQLTISEDRGVLVATVTGEIDLTHTTDLEIQIAESIPNRALGLVLDLTRTTYLDSSGVKLVFDLGNRLRIRGQALAIVVAESGFVTRVLDLVRGEDALDVHARLEPAIERVRASATGSFEDLLAG